MVFDAVTAANSSIVPKVSPVDRFRDFVLDTEEAIEAAVSFCFVEEISLPFLEVFENSQTYYDMALVSTCFIGCVKDEEELAVEATSLSEEVTVATKVG